MKSNRYVNWSSDGTPVPAQCDAYTNRQANALIGVALATPYKPRMIPKTCHFRNDTGKWQDEYIRDEHGNQIYVVDPDELEFQNPDGTWMSCGEVMNIRRARMAAQGDMEAIKQVEDRLLGKPKQQIESLTVSMSLEQFIDSIAQAEAPSTPAITVTVEPAPQTVSIPDTVIDMSWLD
jgi:hypothetical protein